MRYFWNLDPWKKHLGSSAKSKKKTCRMHGFWLLCFVNRDILFSPCDWRVSETGMPRHPATQQALQHCEMKESNRKFRWNSRRENFPESWKFDPQVSKWRFSSNLCMGLSVPLVPQSRGPKGRSPELCSPETVWWQIFWINTAVANCMFFKGFGLAQDIFLQESSVNASRGVRSLAQHQRYKLRLEQLQKNKNTIWNYPTRKVWEVIKAKDSKVTAV